MRVNFKNNHHDYPKHINDTHFAWYNQGKICILRRLKAYQLQTQNYKIIEINRITHTIWQDLSHEFKLDLALYAQKYKQKYPGLRKRGISSYAVFLMITHALIKRFGIERINQSLCIEKIKVLLINLTVYDAVRIRLLKPVYKAYQLNRNPFKPYHLYPVGEEKHGLSDSLNLMLQNLLYIYPT